MPANVWFVQYLVETLSPLGCWRAHNVRPLRSVHAFISAANNLQGMILASSSRTGIALILGQHRTIPALRLKHRSGSCGTASALPKCSIRHPGLGICRTSLAVSALRIMRYCLRQSVFIISVGWGHPIPPEHWVCKYFKFLQCSWHYSRACIIHNVSERS